MNKIKEFFRDWSIFEKVWLIFVCSLMTVIWFINGDTPVSYTHLDVYKRQLQRRRVHETKYRHEMP